MSIASELRKIAEKTIAARENTEVSALFNYLLKQAERLSRQGYTSYKLILDDSEWSPENAKEAKPLLEREGFTVEVDWEIGSQYSNTDWDDQHYIEIKW